jgi:hypothetical protein
MNKQKPEKNGYGSREKPEAGFHSNEYDILFTTTEKF